jgi:hypothetical protein
MRQHILEEVMKQYDIRRKNWIEYHGNDDGFDEWFTKQVSENHE